MTKKEQLDHIIFLNRYTGKKEKEQVLGEKWLRWTYGSVLGRMGLHLLFKRAIFSRFMGYLKNRKSSRKDIAPFVKEYGINMDEALLDIDDYASFNEFFFRKLKPGARPVSSKEGDVVFPADGRHMGWQDASKINHVFVKNQHFDLPALLDSEELGRIYANGTVVLSRLCPVDYHRYHFVADGVPGDTRLIKGPLASVSPYALRRRLAWLWTNKRVLTIMETQHFGRIVMLDVGATAVGSIIQTYQPLEPVKKGDEKGYFAFGGSTVMTFFEPGRIKLCDDLLAATNQGLELYARQGDLMGEAVHFTTSGTHP